MFARLQRGRKLPMAEKFTRLKTRLGDPEWRRYGKLLFAGKAMGIGNHQSFLRAGPCRGCRS